MNAEDLPIRWMPIEAIENITFDEKTDVWSFGVTLWEIMNKGVQPYSGKTFLQIVQFLKNGNRLSNANCSESMRDIMTDCWSDDPIQRPPFSVLKNRLAFIKSSFRDEYVQPDNDTYDEVEIQVNQFVGEYVRPVSLEVYSHGYDDIE